MDLLLFDIYSKAQGEGWFRLALSALSPTPVLLRSAVSTMS